MKEKSFKKVGVALGLFRASIAISVTVGCIFLIFAVVTVYQGIEFSRNAITMVENLNMSHINESSYPAEGCIYELEARIVDDEMSGSWYRHAIVANYGDMLEIRLKIIAANPTDVNREEIAKSLSFMCTDGFAPSAVELEHDKLMLPDGTLADYFDDFSDEHIAYIAVGTYNLCRKDWWNGAAPELFAYVSGRTAATLTVVSPYCEVEVLTVLIAIAVATFFGLALPLVLKVIRAKVLKRLEDA